MNLDPALILILLGSGAVAGMLAGLFGIGGGLLLVPVIAVIAGGTGMDTGTAMQTGIATSMASILLTAIGSITAHHRRGAVRWRFVRGYAVLVMAGAWSGARVVDHIAGLAGGRLLVYVFVTFAVIMAGQLLRGKPAGNNDADPGLAFYWPLDVPAGLLIGHVSAWLGIAGGSMNAPYFHFRGLAMRQAVGTAAACGYPLALAGTVGFVMDRIEPSPWPFLGAVFWPAALLTGSVGLLVAPLGARLAHTLPERLLRALFAGLLLALAARLIML